jgi:hypothetical protein
MSASQKIEEEEGIHSVENDGGRTMMVMEESTFDGFDRRRAVILR